MKKVRIFAVALMALTMLVTSCGKDESPEPTPEPTATTGVVEVEIKLPSDENVNDFTFNLTAQLRKAGGSDAQVGSDKKFNKNKVSFADVPPGDYYIEVFGDIYDAVTTLDVDYETSSDPKNVVAGGKVSVEIDAEYDLGF